MIRTRVFIISLYEWAKLGSKKQRKQCFLQVRFKHTPLMVWAKQTDCSKHLSSYIHTAHKPLHTLVPVLSCRQLGMGDDQHMFHTRMHLPLQHMVSVWLALLPRGPMLWGPRLSEPI